MLAIVDPAQSLVALKRAMQLRRDMAENDGYGPSARLMNNTAVLEYRSKQVDAALDLMQEASAALETGAHYQVGCRTRHGRRSLAARLCWRHCAAASRRCPNSPSVHVKVSATQCSRTCHMQAVRRPCLQNVWQPCVTMRPGVEKPRVTSVEHSRGMRTY